jgi:hypothetical protein
LISNNVIDGCGYSGILVFGSHLNITNNGVSNPVQIVAVSGPPTPNNPTYATCVTVLGFSYDVNVSNNRCADDHTQTVQVTSGSPIVTGLRNTIMFNVGDTITGPDIPGSATVASIDTNTQIHLSANATGTSAQETVVIAHPFMNYCFQANGTGGPNNRTGNFVDLNIDPSNSCTGALTATFEPPAAVSGLPGDVAIIWGWNYGRNPLAGVTAAIGGSSLAAGACSTGIATITGVTSAMTLLATPVADARADNSHGLSVSAFVSGANTVTVAVCALAATTPAAVAYNVRAMN